VGIFSRLFSPLLKPITGVRPEERIKTLFMFFYFFLTIALIYILKPVRNSLFLGELGARNLRYVYMGEGIFLVFVVAAYIQFAKRVSKKILYAGVLWFFIGCLVVFWFLFRLQTPYLSAFFYIWVASFSITMTTQFWMLANDIFNPLEAKRLFGLIISGGSLGGILGGLLTQQAMRWLKTEDLLWVSAGVLFLCILLLRTLWQQIPHAAATQKPSVPLDESDGEKKAKETSSAGHQHLSIRKLFMGSSYLVTLAALVMVAKISSTIIDNQFNRVVEMNVMGDEARTAFFGGFMASLNALSFFMQFFVTSICLRYLGVGFSLWILPLGLTFFSLGSFLYPVLMLGLLFKMFDGSVNYSIQQASKEVLFLPLTSALRYRVKPVIDMLGFRMAKTFGGIYIVLMAPLFGIADERLGLLVLTLIPIWVFVVWRMKKGYSQLLRDHLLRKRVDDTSYESKRATDVLSFLHDEKTFHEIQVFMNHRSSTVRKLAATAYLAYHQSSKDLNSARRLLTQLAQDEAFEKGFEKEHSNGLSEQDLVFLSNLMDLGPENKIKNAREAEVYLSRGSESLLMKLAGVLREPNPRLEAKRRAVRILELIPRQESVDLLLHTLSGAQDHAYRFVMAKALDRLHDKNPSLTLNRFLIKNEIARDARIHGDIQKLRHFCTHDRRKENGEDYLDIALKAILDESRERIFCYLDLLYPHDAIEEIYKHIANRTEKEPIRAQAAELLTNTIEPNILMLIQKVIEEPQTLRVLEQDAAQILKSFLRSQDRWFSLTALFLLSELGLSERWPELDKFAQDLRLMQTSDGK